MGCTCIIDGDVDDFATVLFAKIVKSRKEHLCHECGCKIEKGDEYFKEKSLYGGSISTHKTCLDCKSIRNNLVCSFYWGDVLEMVRDGIQENWGKVSEDCLSKLTPKAQEKICSIIEDIWECDEEKDEDND